SQRARIGQVAPLFFFAQQQERPARTRPRPPARVTACRTRTIAIARRTIGDCNREAALGESRRRPCRLAECLRPYSDCSMAHYDLVIRNATIVDGNRAPRFEADVAVQKGLIQRIGTVGKETSDRVIDAAGKILAPGFIDAHTHDDRLMLSGRDMAPKVSQGVTTV